MLIPQEQERELVHRVIYDELEVGKVLPASKQRYKEIMEALVDRGAEGIILGCTEIGLLVDENDIRVPVFDATAIHAEVEVECALGEKDLGA